MNLKLAFREKDSFNFNWSPSCMLISFLVQHNPATNTDQQSNRVKFYFNCVRYIIKKLYKIKKKINQEKNIIKFYNFKKIKNQTQHHKSTT
jgi:hypothetical protein